MHIKTAAIASSIFAVCLFGVAYAGPSYYCTPNGFCKAKIKRINVNRGDIDFTLQLPASEYDNLPCAAGSSVAGFRLPPKSDGNQRYEQMFKILRLGATRGIPVEILVIGGAYDCQADAIALSFGSKHKRRGR
ncbi:MAG TPA: hypothetical protein VJ998_08475 [Pseudomonadales bacterium]|nr:hypothetical protein [Pseudomonadales bacterium]